MGEGAPRSIPTEDGFYFATSRARTIRVLLKLATSSIGERWAFCLSHADTFLEGMRMPSEFTDYSQRITDPEEKK